MRLDKYLKEARIIKRRVVAKEASDLGHIYMNDKKAKPSEVVTLGAFIRIEYARKTLKIQVTSLTPVKDGMMYILLEETSRG
jgi:ribosomal 50S subunit-recycling heat shock protein